jgi:hypothetical protein
MSSVEVEQIAPTAKVLVQVASLASRHGQINVRAAFFCLFPGFFALGGTIT